MVKVSVPVVWIVTVNSHFGVVAFRKSISDRDSSVTGAICVVTVGDWLRAFVVNIA
jgi:hypothetical protein